MLVRLIPQAFAHKPLPIPPPCQYESLSCSPSKLSYASRAVHPPPLLIIFVLSPVLAPQVKFVRSILLRRIHILHQNHIHLWLKFVYYILFTLTALYRLYKEKTCLDNFLEGCTAYSYHSTIEVNARYNRKYFLEIKCSMWFKRWHSRKSPPIPPACDCLALWQGRDGGS